MSRFGRSFLAMMIACMIAPAAQAAPKDGVFGVVNGKKLKAPNVEGVGDHCVFGIYNQTQGVLVFSALECKRHRRRQGAVRKNYKQLLMACNINYLMPTSTPMPLVVGATLECPISGYSETKTGRFRIPKSTVNWISDFVLHPDNTITSNLKLRIDSFDGSVASGAVFGSFDEPQNGQPGPAVIQGEIQFRFPFQVQ